MLSSLFNTPSRSYAKQQNHLQTPPNKSRLKQPSEFPLPPSPFPPGFEPNRTPLLSADTSRYAMVPSPTGDEDLMTPGRSLAEREGEGDDGLISSRTLSTFAGLTPTPTKSSREKMKKRKKRDVPVLEDFELIRVVGKGCAGRVMMVRHTQTAKIHAMKAISKRSVLTFDELGHTMTEARILKYFARYDPHNPFVVKLDYSFTDRENIYFVMDFYPGGDLATQMELGRLKQTRTRFYAVDITKGLLDLHRHGIIVRDLKPENVLLNDRGHAVLADFGLSKQFPYRGDPISMHVPVYPGEPELPYWAGAGMGSVRPSWNGHSQVVIDRANSFVGTAEYIAPEVLRREDYTYAVDWWALGVIIVEGLLGRVPFRAYPGEDPTVLWDQILLDPWSNVFHDPDVTALDFEDRDLDPATIDFISGLLQKDPAYRLTEPWVQQQPYFSEVDWDLVSEGGYADPEPLYLHPTPEKNLHYFPRLCLQEEVTVDMTDHDNERPVPEDMDPSVKTAMNDESTFLLAQMREYEAFADFEWSRDDDSIVIAEGSEGEDGVLKTDTEGHAYDYNHGEEDGLTLNWSVSEVVDQPEGVISGLDMPAIPTLEGTEDSELDSRVDHCPNSTISGLEANGRISPPTTTMADTSETNELPETPRPDEIPLPESVASHGTSIHSPVLSPVPPPPVDETASPTLPHLIALPSNVPLSSPKSINAPSPRFVTKLRLPSGLPASGLSSSDILSIPSSDPNSPTRLVRRHKPAPRGHKSRLSVDTVRTLTIPNQHLSVDLHGTLSQLGDEDWEKLDNSNTRIPSVPNAAPSAFFTRGFGTLRKRPSAEGGTVRTGRKISGSSNEQSASGESSPTKGGIRHRPMFTVKSIENTKKAFKNLKAFPRRIRDSNRQTSTAAHPGRPSRVTTPTSPGQIGKYGPISAPTTSTGSWFTTRRLGLSRSFMPSDPKRGGDTTASSQTSGSNGSYANDFSAPPANTETAESGVPRVELTQSPPIIWDLGVPEQEIPGREKDRVASEMAEDAEKDVVADTGRSGSESEPTKISKEKKGGAVRGSHKVEARNIGPVSIMSA